MGQLFQALRARLPSSCPYATASMGPHSRHFVPGYDHPVSTGRHPWGNYSRHFVPGYLLPVPTGRHPWAPHSRHFVPGYLLPVPTRRHPWAPIPGTSCQATFFLSLRDGIHGGPIPGTSCQATFFLSLRDGIHGAPFQALRARLRSSCPYGTASMGAYSRHFVPGYLLPVPAGRQSVTPVHDTEYCPFTLPNNHPSDLTITSQGVHQSGCHDDGHGEPRDKESRHKMLPSCCIKV
jgi:hypothetical protein